MPSPRANPHWVPLSETIMFMPVRAAIHQNHEAEFLTIASNESAMGWLNDWGDAAETGFA